MSEEELLRRAEAVSVQRIVVQNFGMMNTPSDLSERVKFDARFMVERDKLSILEKDYQVALRMLEQDTWPDRTNPAAPLQWSETGEGE